MAESKISVVVNGQSRSFHAGCTIRQILTELEIRTSAIAVEVNSVIRSSEKFDSTVLQEGDQIEIVSLVGGG